MKNPLHNDIVEDFFVYFNDYTQPRNWLASAILRTPTI